MLLGVPQVLACGLETPKEVGTRRAIVDLRPVAVRAVQDLTGGASVRILEHEHGRAREVLALEGALVAQALGGGEGAAGHLCTRRSAARSASLTPWLVGEPGCITEPGSSMCGSP